MLDLTISDLLAIPVIPFFVPEDFERDRVSFRAWFNQGPALLEPKSLMILPTPEEILKDTLELIDEVQIDILKRSLADMNRQAQEANP